MRGGADTKVRVGSAWRRAAVLLSVVATMPGRAEESGSRALQAPVGSGDVVSVGASLIVVVAAILLCGWLWSRGQRMRGGAGGVFNVVASQALGPRERILVIEIAGRQLVLGMTASQINTLHVFEEPVVQTQAAGNGWSDSVFAGRLRAALRGGK